MKTPFIPAVCFAALFAALPIQAAIVTWGSPTTISGDNNVSTNGTLVQAWHFGEPGVTPATVNGVTFLGFPILGNQTFVAGPGFFLGVQAGNPGLLFANDTFGAAVGPFTGLSAPYQNMLRSAVYTLNGPVTAPAPPVLLALTGLISGQTYEFQWWANNSTNDGIGQAISAVALEGGPTAILDTNNIDAIGGVGQFVIGSFTANASFQEIIFDSVSGLPPTHITAFQLRQISTPSPVPDDGATAVLLGIGMIGLAIVRRRLT